MKRARSKLVDRVKAQQSRNRAARARIAELKAAASVANGAAALAPVPVAVGLMCPQCRRCVMVSATVNGREVGAPFCPSCGVG
jgi:hypothetical protein